MKKEYITRRQFFTIIYAYVASNEMVRGIYISTYKNNVWLPAFLAMLIAILLFFIYSFIFKNTNSTDFKTAIENILGKVLAKVVFIIYFCYFTFLMILKLRDMAELIHIYLLQDSPMWVIFFYFLIVAVYCVSKGIENIARYAGIVFFISLSTFVFFYILLIIINKPCFENFLPFLPNGIKPLIKPALTMSYSIPMGELFALLIIFENIKPEHKKKAFKTSYSGILIAGLIMILITVSNIIFLEPETTKFLYTPIIRLWRRIDVENFLQRLDLIFANILLLNVMVKISVTLIAAKKMVDGVIKIKKDKIIYVVIAGIVFGVLLFIAHDYPHFIDFRVRIVVPYIKSTFEVFLPILIVLISFFRKNKIKSVQKQLDYNI
ncbi:MAG TPA: endospore germination permease [Acholeplasmataceae bacterium]|nr:endospore germination permease [Acholeplasmataceae bacterium]